MKQVQEGEKDVYLQDRDERGDTDAASDEDDVGMLENFTAGGSVFTY